LRTAPKVYPIRFPRIAACAKRRFDQGVTRWTRKSWVSRWWAGRIGRPGAAHGGGASGRFSAVSDIDAERASRLAKTAGADFCSGDNDDVIAHPRVNAVIVSTSEHEHLAPVMRALELGKPVLVEKPIALTLADADRIIAQSERTAHRFASARTALRGAILRRRIRS
jgi:predicted dehydrogenase